MVSLMRRRFLSLLMCLPWLPSASAAPQRSLLVLGDSLSAAYGLPAGTGWVDLLAARLAREHPGWRVVNASISGETSHGGLRRLPELLQQHQPALVLIELGGNDGLRGLSLQALRANLLSMIQTAQRQQARVLLAGMQLPPNLGPAYTRQFHAIFREVSEQAGASLLPFLLQDIAARDGMMQNDGIHPTGEAQALILENVWPTLQPLLRQ
jgi:acyl-CoA thioesterase-1